MLHRRFEQRPSRPLAWSVPATTFLRSQPHGSASQEDHEIASDRMMQE